MMRTTLNLFCRLLLVVVSLLLLAPQRQLVESSSLSPIELYECSTTEDCEKLVGRGSECLPFVERPTDGVGEATPGKCSNPIERGCLKAYLPGFEKLRVCNSDDPDDAKERGVCRLPDFDYGEVRISGQNWESSMFEAWILQIVLSELLDVPSTIETGAADRYLNVYDPNMPFDYGLSGPTVVRAVTLANDIVDCRLADRSAGDDYQPCLHVAPEVWPSTLHILREMSSEGIIDAPQGMGAIGNQDWYTPKFVGERDPSLLNYLGLVGEDNQRKLAETFLRPTKWKEYCEIVSPDNCTTPDYVAKRAPVDETETDRMFVEDLYTGHFRKTEKNDCDKHPTTCTGHIADYPCGWTSYVEPITHHLNIALESDGDEPYSHGYSYGQLIEIWAAANATKSPVIMMWWSPEALVSKYVGTDAEFRKVALPPTTPECWKHAITFQDRCVEDRETRIGDPRGACGEPASPIYVVTSAGLQKMVEASSAGEVDKSPAYEALKQFTFSGIQMTELVMYWNELTSPREAVCQYVVDNIDFFRSTMVPSTYPRGAIETSNWSSPLFFVSLAFGLLAAILVAWTAWMTHRRREKRAIRFAQFEFLVILLAGLFIISSGAIIVGLPPSDASCVSAIWLINFGYTLELVPLILKVAAINRLMLAARNMRIVVLRRQDLFGAVAGISAVVVGFLAAWTAVDPPRKVPEYAPLSEAVLSPTNETVVTVHSYCSSDSPIWEFTTLAGHVLLLLCASVIAFQTRKVAQDFNEAQTLAMLIYSHFVFVVLRVITFVLSSSVSQAVLTRCRSLIHSVDVIATIFIYFLPKLAATEQGLSRTGATIISGISFRAASHQRDARTVLSSGVFDNSRMPSVDDGRTLSMDDNSRKLSVDDGNMLSLEESKAPEIPDEGEDDIAGIGKSERSVSTLSKRNAEYVLPPQVKSVSAALSTSRPCSMCGHVELQPLTLQTHHPSDQGAPILGKTKECISAGGSDIIDDGTGSLGPPDPPDPPAWTAQRGDSS